MTPPQTTPPCGLIAVQSVSKYFGEDIALSNLDLTINQGEFLTILGPSGCGKTTLLRLLAGFEAPSSGRITLEGKNILGIPPEDRPVNTVFQSYALFPHMTVFENVAFGLRMKNTPVREIPERVTEALRLVKLNGFSKRHPHELSGGQQQRVAIARAIVNDPLMLLLDEPMSALDSRLRKNLQMELKHLQRKLGITFVLVTHDQEEAFSMSDRIVVMDEGELMQVGTPREIYEEPANMFVARFVGEINVFSGRVINRGQEQLNIDVNKTVCTVKNKGGFEQGQKVRILLRPEDMRIETVRDLDADPELRKDFALGGYFRGRVDETVYKGATYDVYTTLASGKSLVITEFFNEDDEDVYFQPGDEVAISWVQGWEVVLPDGE
ncbi:MAG: spermidine/putrescine ABC transporter ATP-binding protein PotA [Desulfoplanes sp.]